MIVFIFLLCCLCNASLLHLKANILEWQEQDAVARLKAKVLDKQSQNPALLETEDDPVISPIPATLKIRQCCNPFTYVNCYNDAVPACCPNGKWVCPSTGPEEEMTKYMCDGVETTGRGLSEACPVKCCDPAKSPNTIGGTTWCLYGAHCCHSGQWVCGAQDGSYVCDGSITKGITAPTCPRQILPVAGLIDTGSDGDRTTSEPQDNDVLVPASFLVQSDLPPAARCCDPTQEPGKNGNPICFEGYKCCLTGEWGCGNADGNSFLCGGQWTPSTGTFGFPCPELPPAAVCCDATKEPGKYGNSICPNGHQCCLTGEWSCVEADGVTFTCNGKPTKEPDGVPCPPDCKEVQCPKLSCPDWQQYTPTGSCCPACLLCSDNRTPLSTTNCKLGKCPTGWNCEGKVVSDTSPTGWHTVGLCCKDCSHALCIRPRCPVWQQYTPQGECCPKCKLCHNGEAPWSTTTDCSTNGGRCPGGYTCEGNVHFDSNGDWSTYGLCCHPDCKGVLCQTLDCPKEQQIQPEGACCPFCKRATCLDGSTPMPGNCPAEQCPVGYSCNGFIDTPVPGGPWFSYGLCCKSGVVG